MAKNSFTIYFKDTTRPIEITIGKGLSGSCRRSCDDCSECEDCEDIKEKDPTAKGAFSTGTIRYAYERDIKGMREIYNDEILTGVATFDLHPRSMEDRKEWFLEHQKPHRPLIVAVKDGIIAGYASLSEYRTKEAFIGTVELSVYVNKMFRGRGVATALMDSIINYAKNDETIHTVVSVITTGNEASIKLHDRFGFTFCGTMPAVGYKFEQYLGIDNYCLIVD